MRTLDSQAHLKGAERVLRSMYKLNNDYAIDILGLLIRRPWSEQPWALDLAELILSAPPLDSHWNESAEHYLQLAPFTRFSSPPLPPDLVKQIQELEKTHAQYIQQKNKCVELLQKILL